VTTAVVNFRSHRVKDNHSDHRAVLAVIWVRHVLVRFVTWNVGPGTAADLRYLLRWAGRRGVVALQECGDKVAMITTVAEAMGFQVITGRQRGRSSTLLLVGADAEVLEPWWRVLLRRIFIGPGAGPSHNKQKGGNGGRLRIDGVKFGALCWHVVPTQGRALRQRAALIMARALLVMVLRRRIPVFVLGDVNATSRSRTVRFLYRAGFTDNHREGGVVPTHGGRDIDRIMWLRKWSTR
jgi:hypothetical protein